MRVLSAAPPSLVPLCSACWPRRLLLTLAMGVVALSVVGMHQLSFGHALATPTAGDHQRTAAAQFGSARSTHRAVSNADEAHQKGMAGVAAGSQVGLSFPTPNTSTGYDEGCPGCSHHSMTFSSCLLALTLLVSAWGLAPPRVRLLPPRLRRPTTALALLGRRVPPLSLAELSILRT